MNFPGLAVAFAIFSASAIQIFYNLQHKHHYAEAALALYFGAVFALYAIIAAIHNGTKDRK